MSFVKNPAATFLVTSALILGSLGATAGEIPSAPPESVGMSAERLARIEPAMQRYIDESLTPGVVTAIVRKGKLVHVRPGEIWTSARARPCGTIRSLALRP